MLLQLVIILRDFHNDVFYSSPTMEVDMEKTDISLNIHPNAQAYLNNPVWDYQDGRGVNARGFYVKHIQGQGSDVTYIFCNLQTGALEYVSGERLKQAKRLWF